MNEIGTRTPAHDSTPARATTSHHGTPRTGTRQTPRNPARRSDNPARGTTRYVRFLHECEADCHYCYGPQTD
ncbi:hypothetical protein GIS00_20830 [Nakamurella sp. YIM 132087]|uniref:Radical SAM protein n=1 Tax=Nakamurella alba TaxID=2665158 RepID=A0A7K1FSL6_9ACTN|nr:hypothetical protein [Nakamurella alba]MTD16389.1 hypothetical protein [Nakamurella alba]